MNSSTDLKISKKFALKAIALGVMANSFVVTGYSHAGPTGGVVVGGEGTITQNGTETRIDQDSHRLALQWDSFNIAADERVQFVQPSKNATALNRIMDNNGSRILGQIEANGRVILMNPNGVFFGENATVNVGSLIASGLNINSDDFMNGDLAFSAIEGAAGTVVNHGLINAATGGNVALIGTSVANHGLISANLGHVALASGSEAVVTFDDQGLIGVRIDQEALASEIDADGAVINAGTLEAKGGKILLNASVSADLFSAAVNRGNLGADTQAVVHDDGSFTLGPGNPVVNTGAVDVSTDSDSTNDAGYVIVAGDTIDHRGTLRANAEGSNQAGQVYLDSDERTDLGAASVIEALNPTEHSGKISLSSTNLIAESGAIVNTSGNTLIAVPLELELPEINTHHLYIRNIENVRQNGSITASGNTHLHVLADSNVRLTDANNDFNTLSLDASYTSNTIIHESNDIELGDLNIEDSSLVIEALGSGATISQSPNSNISIGSSSLSLTADNILLGENNSFTNVNWGSLNLNFGQSINTNQSITLVEDLDLYPSRARITGSDGYETVIEVTSNQAIDLAATLDVNQYTLVIHNLLGSNATLSGFTETTQTGPIRLTDTLTWNSNTAILEHPENGIGRLTGSASLAFSWLSYVDKNDVVIGDVRLGDEVAVNITSLEGTIRQEENTSFRADFIELDANSIDLGASGSSSISAGYVLHIGFRDTLHINGPYSISSYAPSFRITGDDGDNTLIFGEYATSDSFAGEGLLANLDFNLGAGNDTAIFNSEFIVGDDEYWSNNTLNMGPGNNKVFLNESVTIPITLGPGRDYVRIWDFSTQFRITDFNIWEDRFAVHRPWQGWW